MPRSRCILRPFRKDHDASEVAKVIEACDEVDKIDDFASPKTISSYFVRNETTATVAEVDGRMVAAGVLVVPSSVRATVTLSVPEAV